MRVARAAAGERKDRVENGWSEESLNSYMAGFENGLTDTWLQLLNNDLITDKQYNQLIDVLDEEDEAE